MGNRLSQIATRTGDDGTTGLGDGTRVGKDHLRVAALGDVDELNSTIGVLLTNELSNEVRIDLAEIQNDLFDLGGELAIPGYSMISDKQVARLDARLAHYNSDLPRLAEFILPGGSSAAAMAHVCRTVCRRAERSLVALGNGRAERCPAAIFESPFRSVVCSGARLNRHAGVPTCNGNNARISSPTKSPT